MFAVCRNRVFSTLLLANTICFRYASTGRKPSGYNWYVRDAFKREDIKQLHPSLRFKAIAAEWKALTTEQKTEFTKQCEERPAEVKPEKAKSAKSKEAKPAGTLKVYNAYVLFCEELKQTKGPKGTAREQWKSLSNVEKQQYKERAQALNVKNATIVQPPASALAPAEGKWYDMYVSAMLQASDVQELPEAERLPFIEEQWKGLPSEEIAKWIKSCEENVAATSVAESADHNSTSATAPKDESQAVVETITGVNQVVVEQIQATIENSKPVTPISPEVN